MELKIVRLNPFSSPLYRRLLKWLPKNKKEVKQRKLPLIIFLATLLIAASIILNIIYTAYQYVVSFNLEDFISIFSSELITDEKDRTNVLLLGTGGGEHDGADLTDSIIISSLNLQKKTASMVSIPRDLWLDLPGYSSSRINKIYEILKDKYGSRQSLDILRKGVENITNLKIPYVIKVDFEGFTEVVDALGGIEVMVEKSIYDTEYPKENGGGYETFTLEAGLQTLDGRTALKYARSRHSTSDFDRASRQHQILKALQEKALENNFLQSPLLLKKLYTNLSDHIESNMKITELIALANFGRGISLENVSSAVLKDIDVIGQGSFLYPPERDLYGGAFVLVPIGNTYEKIQRFIELVFEFPEFLKEKASIQILNGTKQSGLAARLAEKLIPYGLSIENLGNTKKKEYPVTHFIIHRPERTRVTEEVLKQLFPKAVKLRGDPLEEIKTDDDITIIIGKDIDLKTL